MGFLVELVLKAFVQIRVYAPRPAEVVSRNYDRNDLVDSFETSWRIEVPEPANGIEELIDAFGSYKSVFEKSSYPLVVAGISVRRWARCKFCLDKHCRVTANDDLIADLVGTIHVCWTWIDLVQITRGISLEDPRN